MGAAQIDGRSGMTGRMAGTYARAMQDSTTAEQALDPSPAATVAATAKPILEIGRTWMMDPATAERGAELGLPPGFGFWTLGRAGAMGDVGPDAAAAAIGFMAPDQIAALMAACPPDLAPSRAAEAFAESAAGWGRRTLGEIGDDGLAELAALANRVAAAAPASIGALFAGWRALPQPDDPAGAATVALNVLREHRGAAHLIAAHAVGLGPHGVILSTDDPVRGGASWAEVFGWSAPHPEPDPARRVEAEELTSTLCQPAYETLTGAERGRFVDLTSNIFFVFCIFGNCFT